MSLNNNKNSRWNGGTSAGYILKQCKNLNLKQQCFVCGTKNNLFYHHLNGKKTDNTRKNIKVICKSCHAQIHQRIKNILSSKDWKKKSGLTRKKLIKEGKLIPIRNSKGYFIGWIKT